MSSSAIIIGIIYILALTASVVPLAVGLEPKGESKPMRQVLVALVFAVTQAMMAFIGYLLGTAIDYLFGDLIRYLTFALMLIVAFKMIVDSMKVLKAQRLYTFTSSWGYLLLGVLAGMNAFLMGLCSQGYLPFGKWYFLALAAAGFLWAWSSVRKPYVPKMLRVMSFVEFSGAVFLAVVAVLYLFTGLTH